LKEMLARSMPDQAAHDQPALDRPVPH